MTGALRDPDDLPPVTEERAAEWIAGGYTGHRRAREDGSPAPLIDEQTMADLVAAQVALWLGDREGHDHAEQAALLRLYAQNHSWATAHAAIRHAERDIAHRAHVELDLMRLDEAKTIGDMWRQCPDPSLHRRWDVQAGRTEASWMREARGCCPWCSLPLGRAR